MLPHVEEWKLPDINFPTLWQNVIFRNYGFVPTENIGKTLLCSKEIVEVEAQRLGLKKATYNSDWLEKGYITIIRNNWWFLPYEQILTLLNISQEKLEFILKEEDFLYIKLGWCKPLCKKVTYSELSDEEIKKTNRIKRKIVKLNNEDKYRPFEFYSFEDTGSLLNNLSKNKYIIHAYQTPCGNAFEIDSNSYLSDDLLQEYAKNGVNGLWLHGVLSSLSYYRFKPSLSKYYKKNRERLIELIERAKKYNIGVYLYFNEPRSLTLDDFNVGIKYLMGHKSGNNVCLCFSHNEVREYLYEAIKDLLSEVKDLEGIVTITMSENPTHCNYGKQTNCELCSNVLPEESASLVNNTINKAIKDSKTKTKLIANLWEWPTENIKGKRIIKGIDLLDRDIILMVVSETEKKIEHLGVKSQVVDYAISHVGPSDLVINTVLRAKNLGFKVFAKIQVNNSWECSQVPFMPVYDLIYEHVSNLKKIGISDFMMSWTVGGYPSLNLQMVHDINEKKDFTLAEWYKENFNDNWDIVKKAVKCFCNGFKHFPLSLSTLYFSPKNIGFGNMLSLESENKVSSMVGLSFDDYEFWIKPYSYEVYTNEYKTLLMWWKKGLKILENCEKNDYRFRKLELYSKVIYLHFLADYLQTQFSFYKRKENFNKKKLLSILIKEKKYTTQLLNIMVKDSCIGYEASNHYYYTPRQLQEKIINCDRILKGLGELQC